MKEKESKFTQPEDTFKGMPKKSDNQRKVVLFIRAGETIKPRSFIVEGELTKQVAEQHVGSLEGLTNPKLKKVELKEEEAELIQQTRVVYISRVQKKRDLNSPNKKNATNISSSEMASTSYHDHSGMSESDDDDQILNSSANVSIQRQEPVMSVTTSQKQANTQSQRSRTTSHRSTSPSHRQVSSYSESLDAQPEYAETEQNLSNIHQNREVPQSNVKLWVAIFVFVAIILLLFLVKK